MSFCSLFFRRRRLALALLMGLTTLLRTACGAPPPPVEGGFTLIVVPDSQKYLWQRPEIYFLQTGWIAANVETYNIVHLLHVGDITQHNTPRQWELARRAHRAYENLIPAVYVPGNHDFGVDGSSSSRDSLFTAHVTLADYQRWPGFGGVYDREPHRTENSFHRFTAGGQPWLILGLEFAPRDDVIRWANEIVEAHADHRVIVLTHAYLRPDGIRFNRNVPFRRADGKDRNLDRYPLSKDPEGFNDGEDLWQKLVSRHRNVALVVCGHVCFSAHAVSTGIHGNAVHEILVDYQELAKERNGWLRLLQFMPDGETVRVRDYSPLLDETSNDPACSFEFKFSPLPVASR